MDHFFPEHWSTLYLGLIFTITLAQMLIVYDLSAASTPPAGLGMFTVFSMATMLSWILFMLQRGGDAPLGGTVPSVAGIINSYLLFIAATQRAGAHRGRVVLGIICLMSIPTVFFLGEEELFALQASLISMCYIASGVIFAQRGLRQRNMGDAIMFIASILLVTGMSAALYQVVESHSTPDAEIIAFGAHSWAFVLVVVGFLASVLVEYQQHLSHLATVDPLSQLLNRRGLETSLGVSLARAVRMGLDTSAIAIDIDHFKRVNDSFGHEIGDHVIRQVANLIYRHSRRTDVAARTGGEEFLLVLPETNLEVARRVAQRLCEIIAEHPLWVEQQRIPITVSLGVASRRGSVDLDELMKEADQAMYLAKRNGRNRVAWLDSKPVHLSSHSRRD